MRNLLRCATMVLAASLAISSADAAVTVNITQSGNNVVVDLSGTLNTTGLVNQGNTAKNTSYIIPNTGTVSTGSASALTTYSGLSGPALFGTAGRSDASSATGTAFEIFSELGQVRVFQGFISGGSFLATSTYNNTTLARLGLTSGQYVYRAPNDTITVNIGAVPEPATWGMMLLGFGLVGAGLRSRRRSVAVSAA